MGVHTEESIWRIPPGPVGLGKEHDPFNGKGETYKEAYLRLVKELDYAERRAAQRCMRAVEPWAPNAVQAIKEEFKYE